MAETYNLYQAKTHLSTLLDRAAKGEEIILAKAGKPYARLTPLSAEAKNQKPKSERVFGLLKGKIWYSDNFNDPLPEFEEAFYNSPLFPPAR